MKTIEILTVKEFELIDRIPYGLAKSMNKGDIFLPKGTGWEYKVIEKIYQLDDEGREYTFFISVKKM